MRLLGYPADKISMLTTYNGQKALLKDVVERRCAHHPAFGVPHKVSTCSHDTLSHVLPMLVPPNLGVENAAFLFPCGIAASIGCPTDFTCLPQNLKPVFVVVAQSAD